MGDGARRRRRRPRPGLGRRRELGLREGDGSGGGLGRRLGFGPVRALGILFYFFNNFAKPKKNHRKINKNPKMPKQIFTV